MRTWCITLRKSGTYSGPIYRLHPTNVKHGDVTYYGAGNNQKLNNWMKYRQHKYICYTSCTCWFHQWSNKHAGMHSGRSYKIWITSWHGHNVSQSWTFSFSTSLHGSERCSTENSIPLRRAVSEQPDNGNAIQAVFLAKTELFGKHIHVQTVLEDCGTAFIMKEALSPLPGLQ